MLKKWFTKDKGNGVEPTAEELNTKLPTDTRRISRLGLWVVGVGFGGFLLWAAIVPLDEGVPTQGLVSIDTKRKPIQHLQGGLIREILVKEGQQVEVNQVLVRLGDSLTRANYESARQHYFSVRAMEGRLLAEQASASQISFEPALLAAAKEDPVIERQIQAQRQLLASRRSALAATLSAMRESAAGQQAMVAGAQEIEQNKHKQLTLLKQELEGIRPLVKENYLPLVKQMELERSIAEVSSAIAEQRSSQIRARQTILELRQREIAAQSEYRKEVDNQMTGVRAEVQGAAERFKAATEDLERTEIRSPVSGQVVGLTVQTVGGVIQAGQKLMDIVPEGEVLILETRVAPHLIDRVREGDPVDVRFSSFAHSPQLVVAGVLTSISADVLTDPATNSAYYLARVSVTPEGLKELGGRKMQPGMPVEVIVKTGSRTLLQYLLHPMLKRIAASMKEE